MNINQNPILLMSIVNTYLRDKYHCLEDLCEYEDINLDDLTAKLKSAGFEYIKEINQFR